MILRIAAAFLLGWAAAAIYTRIPHPVPSPSGEG